MRKRLAFSALIVVPALLLVYGAALWVRSGRLQREVVAGRVRVLGTVTQPDDDCGFVPVPRSEGALEFMVGGQTWLVPVAHDEHGTRVPTGGVERRADTPLALALGASYTYGFGVPAEAAWPHVVGELTGWDVYNAAYSGYGLGSLRFRAEQLMPELRPDYVLLQYSPWLMERASGPTVTRVPCPFYAWRGDELVALRPSFRRRFVDARNYVGRPERGAGEFFLEIGLPLLTSLDAGMTRHWLRMRVRGLRAVEPTPDVLRRAYREFVEYIAAQGATPVLVHIETSNQVQPLPPPDFPGVVYVDAHAACVEALDDPASAPEYMAAYWMRWGDWWDGHPTPRQHRLIAEAVAAALVANAPGSDTAPVPG